MTETTTPVLTVGNGNWGRTSLRTIDAVLKSAADVLLDAYGRQPDAPIHVAWWSQDPRVFDDRRPYQIRLNARDTHWCQFVYQFSHELCHVMTNFDRYKGHKHRWFDESLCELASLFVLHRLADTWARKPSSHIADATAFAPNHRAYAERIASRYSRPRQHDLPRWLTENITTLQINPYERALNGTVAVTLLGRFLADPSLWRECGHLNHWDPHADATFGEYVGSWASHLRAHDLAPRTPTLIAELFEIDRR